MIAMALSCSPKLLIADEPTTALDVTVQAQVMEEISRLQREMNMGMILITHDLGVIAETCTRVVVMYCGKIIEMAETEELFETRSIPTPAACSIQSHASVRRNSNLCPSLKEWFPTSPISPKDAASRSVAPRPKIVAGKTSHLLKTPKAAEKSRVSFPTN